MIFMLSYGNVALSGLSLDYVDYVEWGIIFESNGKMHSIN